MLPDLQAPNTVLVVLVESDAPSEQCFTLPEADHGAFLPETVVTVFLQSLQETAFEKL